MQAKLQLVDQWKPGISAPSPTTTMWRAARSRTSWLQASRHFAINPAAPPSSSIQSVPQSTMRSISAVGCHTQRITSADYLRLQCIQTTTTLGTVHQRSRNLSLPQQGPFPRVRLSEKPYYSVLPQLRQRDAPFHVWMMGLPSTKHIACRVLHPTSSTKPLAHPEDTIAINRLGCSETEWTYFT
jgi:hypothetical protein